VMRSNSSCTIEGPADRGVTIVQPSEKPLPLTSGDGAGQGVDIFAGQLSQE
jgi:hypothetical protein